MQINNNIKLIRELSGVTQSVFAGSIKTKLSNLKTYENTDVRPKAKVLGEIAFMTGLKIQDLDNPFSPETIAGLRERFIQLAEEGFFENDSDVEKGKNKSAKNGILLTKDELISLFRSIADESKKEVLAEKELRRQDSEKRILFLEKMLEDKLDKLITNSESLQDDLFHTELQQRLNDRALMNAVDKLADLPEGSTQAAADNAKRVFLQKVKNKDRRSEIRK